MSLSKLSEPRKHIMSIHFIVMSPQALSRYSPLLPPLAAYSGQFYVVTHPILLYPFMLVMLCNGRVQPLLTYPATIPNRFLATLTASMPSPCRQTCVHIFSELLVYP